MKELEIKDLLIKDLLIEDFEIINYYYNLRRTSAADGNVLDLFLWNDCYPSKILITEKCLIVLGMEDGKYCSMMPFCKKEDLRESFFFLKELFNNHFKQELIIYVADREAIDILSLPEEEFEITEERDLFDYIYESDKLKSYPGRKYHKKKNHLNAFRKSYAGRYEFKMLGTDDCKLISDFLEKWRKDKTETSMSKYIDYEISGIEKIMKWQNVIDFKIGGLFIDNNLEAFSIGKYYETEDVVYVPVEKANSQFRGIYAYICSKFLREAFPEASRVNREDDMGLEGLRQAKLSLNPIELVEKYTVIQK
ncbi:MAG: phosphatidylglycerol lysyltransferase domain-containing protein [Pseudobutyrivibrio sp.]|nr:phosphatidylglycerol lysyltransferase domain-containing protein [Pseudobutyrivibrio sp.]